MKSLQQKREEADARNAERAARTPREQIARLDAQNGVGIGAKKERARLWKMAARGDGHEKR